ncbi:MAG: P1 family peptidase [Clostridiales Family XIII bacterium]|jgi:L-aminopeptidase/D-esterase-like protein|nr:P1 family peptidase [Clostridiales Family XIII bacterium]
MDRNIRRIGITEIDGFRFGAAEDAVGATGCTVVICPDGAVAGVDVRGGGPATRETDLLAPDKKIDRIHAVVLSGGSAFGLDAASGVMAYLEEHEIGYDTFAGKVPIVCGASLFDLIVGDAKARPDKAMGYAACTAAFDTGASFQAGNHGAGTGATVGKYLGPARMMKSGIGAAAVQIGDIKIGAVAAVNAMGDVYDPETGALIAGMLAPDGETVCGTSGALLEGIECGRDVLGDGGVAGKFGVVSGGVAGKSGGASGGVALDCVAGKPDGVSGGVAPDRVDCKPDGASGGVAENTTLVCVVTNAMMTKPQAARMATLAHDGMARAVRPVHTSVDGDAVFAMASGKVNADADVVACIAADLTAEAIKEAALASEPAYGLKSARDFR